MRALCVLVLFGGCVALPRIPREDGVGAEVIRIVDDKTPILLSAGTAEEENNVVPVIKIGGGNGTQSAEAQGPTSPSPVPENVAITTEQYVTPTPALVPSVVDISTVDPNNTPPPPANATAAAPPDDEDEEESDEGSEEEADEGEEDDEEEEEEDEEDEEESDDEEEEDDAAKAKRLALKKVVKREVAGEEIPSSFKEGSVSGDGEGEKQSDEEDKPEKKEGVKKPVKAESGSGLQNVPASVGLGEDDEADSALQHTGKVTSVIIS